MSLLNGLFPIATDSEGRTIPNALLYSYDAGTNTLKDTYSDSTLLVPNANPLEADGGGWFENVYLGAGGYKLVLRDAAGVVIRTQDNYYQALDGTDLANIDTDIAAAEQQTVRTLGFYTDSGAADAYVLSEAGAGVTPTAYATGMIICFKPANANTGASTVNVNSLGLRNLYDESGNALAASFLETSAYYNFIYVSSNFRFLSKGGLVDSGYMASGAAVANIGTGNLPLDAIQNGTANNLMAFNASAAATSIKNPMRLITSGSLTAAASLEFILSTLDSSQSVNNSYLIRLIGIQPSADDQELWMTLSSDAGSTYASTLYESISEGKSSQSTATVIGVNYTAAAQMCIAGGTASNSLSNAANETAMIDIYLSNVNTGTSLYPHIWARCVYYSATTPYYVRQETGASRLAAADYDAVKLTWESGGNFAAVGKYYLYAIPNSL